MISPDPLLSTAALKCLDRAPFEFPTFSRPVHQDVSTTHSLSKDQHRRLSTVKQIETQVAEREQTNYRIGAEDGRAPAFPDPKNGNSDRQTAYVHEDASSNTPNVGS